jgi:hypothetical protein
MWDYLVVISSFCIVDIGLIFKRTDQTWQLVLLLPNTDCLQKFEDFVRGCTCQLQKIKTIWRHGNVWILLYAKLRSDTNVKEYDTRGTCGII